jgi:hypothetical protein
MLDVLKTKSLHTSVLAALLFYLFANPSTFKMLKKFPGLQFVMKGIQVTQSGVVVNALLFGIVMFLCVYLINNTILRSYLNVVEGHANEDDTDDKDDEAVKLEEYLKKLGEVAAGDVDSYEREVESAVKWAQ